MAAQDPSESVQLPHGTDVVTRVERDVAGEFIAAGSVGRVVSTSDEAVDVQILGVGVVRYLRSEVAPFRSGQLRYALARDAAWNALHRNVVIETTVGSRAWGLAEGHSDVDRRGVFVLPFPWTARIGAAPEDLVSADGSSTYWELAKVVAQALRADPNTLEMLFVPNTAVLDPLGEQLLLARDAFVSARIYASFGQYALSQLKKLKRSLRLAEHHGLLLEWLRAEASLSLDAASARLADAAKFVAPAERERQRAAKEYIKQLYASLFDQGLLSEKSFDALRAYARDDHVLASEVPRRLRPKNAYNLLRLLITATRWLRTGSPTFEMTGDAREELLRIKHGEVELTQVLARAEALAEELDDAHRSTCLPQRPDLERAQQLLLSVRAAAAQRWLGQGAGAFGREATAIPLPEWNV